MKEDLCQREPRKIHLGELVRGFLQDRRISLDVLRKEIRSQIDGLPFAIQYASGFKIETYVFMALILHAATDRLFETKDSLPPYGVGIYGGEVSETPYRRDEFVTLRPLSTYPPEERLSKMNEAFHDTVIAAIEDVMFRDCGDVDTQRVVAAFKRLVGPLIGAGVPILPPHIMLRTGVGTATQVIGNVVRIIPKLLEREKNESMRKLDIALSIARNSIPFILRLSSLEKDEWKRLEARLTKPNASDFIPQFDEAHFSLQSKDSDPSQLELTLPRELLSNLEESESEESRSEVGVKMGCPARFRIHLDRSSIERLFEFYLQGLGQDYFALCL